MQPYFLSVYPKNTKQSPQSICSTVTTHSLPKCNHLILNACTISFSQLLTVLRNYHSFIPTRWDEQSEETLKFQTVAFLQLMCYWQSNLTLSALRGVRCFSSRTTCLNFTEAPLPRAVGRAIWAPRCLLWICAFVLLFPVYLMFGVPRNHIGNVHLILPPEGSARSFRLLNSEITQGWNNHALREYQPNYCSMFIVIYFSHYKACGKYKWKTVPFGINKEKAPCHHCAGYYTGPIGGGN